MPATCKLFSGLETFHCLVEADVGCILLHANFSLGLETFHHLVEADVCCIGFLLCVWTLQIYLFFPHSSRHHQSFLYAGKVYISRACFIMQVFTHIFAVSLYFIVSVNGKDNIFSDGFANECFSLNKLFITLLCPLMDGFC